MRSRGFDASSYTSYGNKSPALGSVGREGCGLEESGIHGSMEAEAMGENVNGKVEASLVRPQ